MTSIADNGLENSYFYKWDNKVVSHQRSIYTFWDYLGDVGGLFDMLKLIG